MPTGRRYIGSSGNISERFWRHRTRLRHGKHHIALMQQDWNEYGEAAFTFIVLREIADPDKRFDAEQAGIDEARAAGLCYNPSPTARTPKGVRLTPEQLAVHSEAMRGRKVSEATRRKISDSNKANWAARGITDEDRARFAEMGRKGTGRTVPPEVRARISAAQKGRPVPAERRAKLSAAATGKTHSPEARAKIAAGNKGRACPTAKLTADQAREIRRRARAGERTSVLAREFGVGAPAISSIKSGKSWVNLD